MPKVELDGEELFNLSLAVLGLALRDGAISLEELSEHFGVSQAAILKAVKAITDSEDVGRYQTHFYLDDDALEDGVVIFSRASGQLEDPPRLSRRQASALAAGLDYLSSLPQFEGNQDLAELKESLAGDITTSTPAAFSPLTELSAIRASIESGLQLEIDYLNQLGERGSRTVDPLRIDFVGSRYYLRAYCYKNLNVRSFRVDRIAGITQLQTQVPKESLTLEIPEDVFGGGEDQHIVTISCSKWASEIFWNFPLVGEPKASGEVIQGQIRVGNLRALGRHIARYGGQVRVLEPAAAVAAVREYALEVLKFQEGE